MKKLVLFTFVCLVVFSAIAPIVAGQETQKKEILELGSIPKNYNPHGGTPLQIPVKSTMSMEKVDEELQKLEGLSLLKSEESREIYTYDGLYTYKPTGEKFARWRKETLPEGAWIVATNERDIQYDLRCGNLFFDLSEETKRDPRYLATIGDQGNAEDGEKIDELITSVNNLAETVGGLDRRVGRLESAFASVTEDEEVVEEEESQGLGYWWVFIAIVACVVIWFVVIVVRRFMRTTG